MRFSLKMVPVLTLIIGIYMSPQAHAISASELPERFGTEILPWVLKTGQTGTLIGTDGIELHTLILKPTSVDIPSKGAIVLLPGRTETFYKYAELMFDLRGEGYTFYTYDHRGQGLSGRFTKDTELGHVDNFDHYIRDLELFMTKVVKPAREKRIILLAHSMGGGIGTEYVFQHPTDFDSVILSSPMLKIQTPGYPYFLAKIFTRFLNPLDYNPRDKIHGYDETALFKDNELTHSPERFLMLVKGIFNRFKFARLGAPSNGWLRETFRVTDKIRKREPHTFLPPTLIFRAGQDTIVNTKAHFKLCNRQAINCKMVFFPDARHEILMERDDIREDAVAQIKEVLRTQAASN